MDWFILTSCDEAGGSGAAGGAGRWRSYSGQLLEAEIRVMTVPYTAHTSTSSEGIQNPETHTLTPIANGNPRFGAKVHFHVA